MQQQFKVTNPSNGVVVVTPDPEKQKVFLRFEAKGDQYGGDTQYLSREAVQQPDFMRAVQRGNLVVEIDKDDPLASMLRAQRRRAKAQPSLTAIKSETVFEGDAYEMREVRIPVHIDPLVKG